MVPGAWTLPGSAPRPPQGRDQGNPGHEQLAVGNRGNTVPPDQQDWPYATQCWDKNKKIQYVLNKKRWLK